MVRHPLRYCLIASFIVLSQWAYADRESDSLALVDLYNSTEGAAWFSAWNLAASMSSWAGVTLDAAGNVIALNLDNRNIVGALPDLNLPELTQLVISNNNLREEMPSLGNLSKLQFLDLSNNRISGPIPDFDLPALQTLRLLNNRFSGEVPNFSGMPQLVSLNLTSNMLSGALPNFTSLTRLNSLRMPFNELEGPLPNLNFAPNLIILDLGNNKFFGTVPIFGASTNLFEIRLSNNNLSGFVPRFNRTPFLDVLLLDNNNLVGPVATLGQLEEARTIDLSGNQLEGSIEFATRYPKLEELDLSSNIFDGSIPSLDLPALRILDLSDNRFSDTLPDLSNLTALSELRLQSNMIRGVRMDASTMNNLQELNVSDNRLTFDPLLRLNGIDVPNFTYSPQKRVILVDTIFATIQDDVIIDLGVDAATPNTIFEWSFNDIFLVATATNELVLPRINALNAGRYRCRITNNFLPALAIETEEILLLMDCPFNEVVLVDTICSGDTVVLNGVPYFESGIYADTVLVTNPGICDSIYRLELTVSESFDTMVVDTICATAGYVFGDTVVTTSGTYMQVFTAQNGCDSMVTLQLTVFPSFAQVGTAEICAGDTLFVGDFFHTTPGIYFDTLQTQLGCDSVIITDLNVLDSFLSVTTLFACPGDTITYRGLTFTESTLLIERFTDLSGCDSTYVLDLTIPESTSYPQEQTICSMDSVMIGDTIYRDPGVYVDSLTSSRGCDSIVLLTLNVVDLFEEEIDMTICLGDTVDFGGQRIITAGIFIDSLIAQGGCDSIVKLRLNVVPFVPRSIDTLLCHNETLEVGPFSYSSSGIFRDTLRSTVGGCDTIIVSRVSILDPITLESVDLRLDIPVDTGYIAPEVRGGSGLYRYLWSDGSTALRLSGVISGTYTLQIFDEEGCDTIFEFTLDQTTSTYAEALHDIALYPNPVTADQQLNLSLGTGSWHVEIVDLMGKIVSIHKEIGQEHAVTAPKHSGIYAVRIVQASSGAQLVLPLVVH
ncbi:MAG: T9SS type A sorting domain-containing protein [Saprospiraceae bacterium]|nr:T9SS type A sorting domain-containing protein [Saprospiraceae bacterium]